MASSAPAAAAVESNAVASAAYRALLCHLPATQRQLARGACVCRGWRAAAAALPAHNCVLRFEAEDAASASVHVVARLLERNAPVVCELRAAYPLRNLGALLPPALVLPRLLLVSEDAAQAPGLGDDTNDAVRRAASSSRVALLHAAPQLVRWHTAPDSDNVVPVTMWTTFTGGPPYSRYAAGPAQLAVAEDAARRMLTPARAALFLHAHFRAAVLPPGVRSLVSVFSAVAPRFAAAAHTLRRVVALTGVTPQIACVVLRAARLAGPRFQFETVEPFTTQLDVTLLHFAVSASSVAAAAVLLSAGADPMAAHAGQPSPLQAAAAEVLELCGVADALEHDDPWRLDSGIHPASDSAEVKLVEEMSIKLPVFLLLQGAAQRRYGNAAVAAALPDVPALAELHTLRHDPFSVHELRRGCRCGARMTFPELMRGVLYSSVRAKLYEMESYMWHGHAGVALWRGRVSIACSLLLPLTLLASVVAVPAWLAFVLLRAVLLRMPLLALQLVLAFASTRRFLLWLRRTTR